MPKAVLQQNLAMPAKEQNRIINNSFLYVFGDIPGDAYVKFVREIGRAIEAFNQERHTQYVRGVRGKYVYTPYKIEPPPDIDGEEVPLYKSDHMFEVEYLQSQTPENQEDNGIDLNVVEIVVQFNRGGAEVDLNFQTLQFGFLDDEWNIACYGDNLKREFRPVKRFLDTMNPPPPPHAGRKQRRRTRRTRRRRTTLKSRFVR